MADDGFAADGLFAEAGPAPLRPACNVSPPARQTAIFPKRFMVSIYCKPTGTQTPAWPFGCAPLFHILAQLDIPVGEVNEVFPTVVPVQGEVDLDERSPLGPLGFADEMQVGLLRRAVG